MRLRDALVAAARALWTVLSTEVALPRPRISSPSLQGFAGIPKTQDDMPDQEYVKLIQDMQDYAQSIYDAALLEELLDIPAEESTLAYRRRGA